MNPVEHITGAGADRLTLKKIITDLLNKILHRKKLEEIAEQAVEAQRRRQEREAEINQQRSEDEFSEKDARRRYRQARSARIEEASEQVAREKRLEEVLAKLDNVVSDAKARPHGSDQLIRQLESRNVRTAIENLMRASPVAVEVVNDLVSCGRELYGNVGRLIECSQKLTYEAEKSLPNWQRSLGPIFDAISVRAKELLKEEMQMKKKVAEEKGGRGPENYAKLLDDHPQIIATAAEIQSLSSDQTWEQAVDSLVRNVRPIVHQVEDWARRDRALPDAEIAVPRQMVAPIDRVWGEIERRMATGDVGVEDLQEAYKKIREEEAKIYPADVPPGSEAYIRAVRAIDQYTEEKIKLLQEKLQEKLRQETPHIKAGITDPEEFLRRIIEYKGHLGGLFHESPEMEKLFLSRTREGRRFRDQVFLKIHHSILMDQKNSSHDNFGLYERADFSTFIGLLHTGFEKYRIPETNQSMGQALSDYYNNLSNAIRQCRDLDFWASKPGANIQDFNKSLSLFQNEYINAATMLPAVNAAFRAYELTLRSIMSSNDGYIPPALIEYTAPGLGSEWDRWSYDALQQMIDMGVVPEIYRDEETGLHRTGKDGHTLELLRDEQTHEVIPVKLSDLSEDEKMMYMTLAKGLGMVSARFIEMFANCKIPGSEQPDRGIDQFHSTPYEGVAKAMNYFSTYLHKWKMGSYKYFYLLNQLIPDKRRWVNDSRGAIEAYMAYQDGTFEEKYGTEAKRFMDLMNFSRISSAIGLKTLWRQWDSTVTWNDKQREWLGGPTQLALSGRYAQEAVKRFLVVNKYREMYRQELIQRNQAQPGLNLPTSGARFDMLWQEYGAAKYSSQIDREWEKLTGLHPKKGKQHTPLRHQTEHLINAYQKAFQARVWVEMAMRNPLVVAHSLKVDMPLVGIDGKKGTTLHHLLVQDILGITPEDTKYAPLYGKAGYGATPEERQKRYMKEVLRLEQDLAAVREIAIEKGDDLTEADFRAVIKDPHRLEQALEYWRKVRQVILGTDNLAEARRLYDRFGLRLLDNGTDYAWDYEKIHKIDEVLDELMSEHTGNVASVVGQDGAPIGLRFLLKQAIETTPEWIYGTDDIAFRKMDILNLGSRQWLRRGGDIAAHEAGGDAVVDYFRHFLTPKPDKHKLAEQLNKVVDAYSGDMIEIGWSVAGNLAYMTDRLYTWDWKRFGSAAQKDVWGTQRGVDAWMANARREFWDALEHLDVLPPHSHFYHYNWISPEGNLQDIHKLREMCNADNISVWKEIIALGLLIAIAYTIYKALTAKEEEGGGHH